MPFTAQELAEAAKSGLDYYLKNKPVDQIRVKRPLLDALNSRKKSFPGSQLYVIATLRKQYGSVFQWFNGSQTVTYNKRNTLEQAKYPWRSAHDGFAIDEDRLAENGIAIRDGGRGGEASAAEWDRLVNILEEQNEVLDLGFDEKMSMSVHLDGSSSSDAIGGIDLLVSTAPSTGTVGGIDRATNTWARNHASTGLTSATILDAMETAWRAATRSTGGVAPDFIEAGAAFIDVYRAGLASAGQQINYVGGKPRDLDGGVGDLFFKGVPIVWNPEFDDNFGGAVSPVIGWTKRCYMLNTRTIRLRPMEGHDKVVRKPPRAYDRYEYYAAIVWRGALTCDQFNANAVLSVA